LLSSGSNVVGEAKIPLIARELTKGLNVNVITLNFEIPKMDVITFGANLLLLRPISVI